MRLVCTASSFGGWPEKVFGRVPGKIVLAGVQADPPKGLEWLCMTWLPSWATYEVTIIGETSGSRHLQSRPLALYGPTCDSIVGTEPGRGTLTCTNN